MAPSSKTTSATAGPVAEVLARHSTVVSVSGLGTVHLPAPQGLAYLAGLAALGALGIMEWPITVALGLGHILAHQHWSGLARGLGQALEEA